jgi:pimeloyl-ACP methyl ester carboxylesterase/DNA-binding CsgD family transcriptional regulator/class 3 adenylate cyclase
MLIRDGSNLGFRHELARQAVLEAMSPVSKLNLHEHVLAALRDAGTHDPARLAHHAEMAGNQQAVLEFAPAAAHRAAALGSHREAGAQYARALRFADDLPPDQRAELLEALSYECYLTDRQVDAVHACEGALHIWRRTGNSLKEGNAERQLSRILWASGRNLEANGAGLRAVRILEALTEGSELALAYSNLAQLRMLAWYFEEAIRWGEKAIALAEPMGETSILVHALTNVGTARSMLEREQGQQEMEWSLSFALEHGFEDHAARAYATLGCGSCERYQFAQADRYLTEGAEYCAEHDLEFMGLYLRSWHAISLMYQGHWADATDVAESVLGQSQASPLSRIMALVALGRVQARQGSALAAGTLDRALELAGPIGELQRLGPVRTARAEAAWLAGDHEKTLLEAADHYEIAVVRRHRWLVGDLAFWRWRAGDLSVAPEWAFEPFALQIAGNWKEAAARWRALGCPYETASALADSDDEADLRYALAEFNRLEAAPMATMVSARLREKTEHRIRTKKPLLAAIATTPETRYARSGDVHIAYQVIGDGPIDLVFVMGWISNLELFWEGPSAAFLRRLASFSRLIVFDKRGTGLSDKVSALPTIEQRMDDVRAVMDAAGSERAVLFGISEGGAMCTVFAATFPHKTSALIVYGGYAKRVWALDYPWAPTPTERQAFYDAIEQGWGGVVDLDTLAPSAAGDPRFREWWASYLRRSSSPGAALALAKMNTEIDIRAILPAIRVPTLILHRTGDLDIAVGGARYLADHIPGATYVELPGNDHLVFAGDQDAILDEIELFLSATMQIPAGDRVLATVLSLAPSGPSGADSPAGYAQTPAGLAAWRRDVEQALAEHRGNLMLFQDGRVLASFDGPGRAIRAACALAETLRRRGMTISAGLHTGECIVIDGTLSGAAVEIATEIMSSCAPEEIVVASTVKDLVAGSGFAFEPVGTLIAREYPDGLPLYRVVIDLPQPVISLDVRPRVIREREAPVQISKRETEIAVLIAGGLSNRQIADALSISPATAERHVSNIFNKLGYHSRAQIAAWAVEHELTDGRG